MQARLAKSHFLCNHEKTALLPGILRPTDSCARASPARRDGRRCNHITRSLGYHTRITRAARWSAAGPPGSRPTAITPANIAFGSVPPLQTRHWAPHPPVAMLAPPSPEPLLRGTLAKPAAETAGTKTADRHPTHKKASVLHNKAITPQRSMLPWQGQPPQKRKDSPCREAPCHSN